MGKNTGKIYSWTNKEGILKKGIAYDKYQVEQFTKFNKVALKEVDEKFNPTKVCTVKNISEIKLIGFVD